LPKAIAVLGERLGCKANKVNLSAGLPDVQLGRAFKRTLTKQDRDPTRQSSNRCEAHHNRLPHSLAFVRNDEKRSVIAPRPLFSSPLSTSPPPAPVTQRYLPLHNLAPQIPPPAPFKVTPTRCRWRSHQRGNSFLSPSAPPLNTTPHQ